MPKTIETFDDMVDNLYTILNLRKEGSPSALREIEIRKAADPFLSTDLASQAIRQELATQYIREYVNQSALLSAVRTHITTAKSGSLAKLNISGHVVEEATENNTASETRKPTTDGIDYLCKKYRASMDLTGELAEDNIEGDSGRAAFKDAFMTAIANDTETLAIEGDSSITGTTDSDRLLKTNDGWNTLFSSTNGVHVVDAGGKRISYKLLVLALQNLPVKYWRKLNEYRWFVSPRTVLDYGENLQSRTTALGDGMTAGPMNPPSPEGIQWLRLPLFPTDLTVTGTSSRGTVIWLARPKNLIHVVRRAVRFYEEFKPRKDGWEITAYGRTDFVVENYDEIVKITNVSLDPTASAYGT